MRMRNVFLKKIRIHDSITIRMFYKKRKENKNMNLICELNFNKLFAIYYIKVIHLFFFIFGCLPTFKVTLVNHSNTMKTE